MLILFQRQPIRPGGERRNRRDPPDSKWRHGWCGRSAHPVYLPCVTQGHLRPVHINSHPPNITPRFCSTLPFFSSLANLIPPVLTPPTPPYQTIEVNPSKELETNSKRNDNADCQVTLQCCALLKSNEQRRDVVMRLTNADGLSDLVIGRIRFR
jgi:hypothetical protein